MPVAAIAGGAALGGLVSGAGSYMGAKAQEDAANRASDTQWAMFNRTRKDNMPWMNAGRGGLNSLMGLYGMETDGAGGWNRAANPMATAQQYMQQDPSYQFRFGEGQRALENSALARGNFQSGNMLRAMSDYGQNMASTEFNNIANRLSALSGVGQSTGQYLGGVGANAATNVGNNMMQAGAARASGYTGMANALNGMMNSGASMYGASKNGFFG